MFFTYDPLYVVQCNPSLSSLLISKYNNDYYGNTVQCYMSPKCFLILSGFANQNLPIYVDLLNVTVDDFHPLEVLCKEEYAKKFKLKYIKG